MKIKALAGVVTKAKQLVLYDDADGQWAGDGMAAYLLPPVLGKLSTSALTAVLDIPTDKAADMDAWRDDDKYQSFLDKWLEAMFGGEKITEGNLLQDLLIHNKLPFIKDFDNLIKVSMYEVSQQLSGDGSINGEEAKTALERERTLSNEERAILWQLQNKSWKAAKNPFDQEIGKRIYDAMHGGSSEGLTLGSANQQTAGSAAASADEGLRLGGSEEPKTGTWIPEAWDQPLKLGSW